MNCATVNYSPSGKIVRNNLEVLSVKMFILQPKTESKILHALSLSLLLLGYRISFSAVCHMWEVPPGVLHSPQGWMLRHVLGV